MDQEETKGLTRMELAESKEASNAGGLCCRHGIGLGKPYENWKERVIEFVRQVDDNLNKNENEEIVAEKVLKFDAASGQALQGSVTIEAEQKDEPPKLDVMNIKTLKRPRDIYEKIILEKLAKNQRMTKNLTKTVALYLPSWKTPSFRPWWNCGSKETSMTSPLIP
ncbi:hypothetical protein F8M41_016444 [Gigaspora margarita]|uniref:Uncharacterized protein n=1 Tax=Gigaspora margarita TaxID=4874 RepID=A0A8H3WVP8_GIGMA|nr:hypothetical protein F8M41_016444 [Gigaspora margarita]